MDRRGVPETKRRKIEAFIRVLDLIAYSVIAVGGVGALLATPKSVTDGFDTAPTWFTIAWVCLLFFGGAVGFVGRLSRFWMVEAPATILAITGALIYFVVLGRLAFTTVTAVTTTTLVCTAAILLARRWAELQLFSIDPEHPDFRSRMVDMVRRRTQDFPQRHG